MTLPKTLPKPDEYGNYWFGSHQRDAVIFPFKRLVATGPGQFGIRPTGDYYLLLDSERGFVFDGPQLRRFGTPQAVLTCLRQHQERELPCP